METKRTSDELPEVMTVGLADVLRPIAFARGLPNPCYHDRELAKLEFNRVFADGWTGAGFSKDAAQPGDVYPFEMAGLPFFMARGRDKQLRVFHNVCQHRGRTLVAEPKNVKKAMVCPYHSWTYGLAGDLIGTPHIGGVGKHSCPGFDKKSIALKEVPSAEWFGLVFINLAENPTVFGQYIAPIAERWRAFEGLTLVHTGADSTIKFELACNWKLAVENYCESYHLPWVHPQLNTYSPLDRHRAIIEPAYSGQISDCYGPEFPAGAPAFPNAPELPAFWASGAEYISLFPNVLLGLHRDHYFAVLIQPRGPEETHERFEIFYYSDAVTGPAFEASRANNRRLWQSIFAEDRNAVESMQRGRRSPGFDGGRFSPEMDQPTHIFHQWIARALIDGRSGEINTAAQATAPAR